MLNKVLDNQAEQIAVTPDQAAYVLKNKAEFKNKVDVDVSMYNTNIANSYINNKLAENPDWNKYLSDPLRRSNPNYKRWKSVEDLMSDENYVSIAKKYGDDLAKQSDIVLDYVKPKSGLERVIMGYNAARYGLRYADARKELSDAMEEGDDAKIAQAQQNLQKELFNLQYNSDEFDSKYWQSASSIAASVARNIPAMIASDVATSVGMGLVGGPLTAGASLVTKWGARAAKLGRATKITAESIGAARKAIKTAQAIKGVKAAQKATEFAKGAAKAGIVFGDTYKVESGSILLELDQSHPSLSEDRKRDLAEAGGIINATIETIPMLAGVGFQAGMSKLLSKATSNAMVKTGVTAKMVKDPAFLKEFAKQIEKNSAKFKFKQFTGEVAADMATNAIQEVLQDCISKAAVYAADNPDTSILAQGLETFADFVSNPLSERNADLWDTFVNTALASPMFSGGMSLGGMAIDAVSGSGSMWKKAAGAKNNSTLAEKLNKWNKESEVGKVSPETVNQNLANLVKNGDAPATVTFDSVAIKEALESADKEVQEAMAKLDMARRYEESKDNGGMIEMTLPEYNELVNQESTGKLFQIVRSMVSFDPNSLSQSEFLRYMTTDGKAMSVLEDAVADKESAYNKSYEKFIASGWDEKQARYEATMAQLVSDRLASITGSGLTGSQYFAKNIDIRTGLDQPGTTQEPTSVTTDTTGRDVATGEETEGGETSVVTTEENVSDIDKGTSTEAAITEEDAEQQITTGTSATVSVPADIMFDINSKESNYENNFKKNGEIKQTVKAKIQDLFTARDFVESDGILSALLKLIGTKNSKWIKDDVSSLDIVNLANKYNVSPTQIYRAVNIARGQPEARAAVVFPAKTLSNEDRARIIKYFIDKNQSYVERNATWYDVTDLLNKLPDYELALLYWLDPKYLYKAHGGEWLGATLMDKTSLYVDKKSLEKTFSNIYGGVYYSFAQSKGGAYYLWGKIGNNHVPVIEFKSKEDMTRYQDEHTATEITNEVVSFVTGKLEDNLKQLNEGISRKGKDYREGRNVTKEEVEQRFGFRNIQLYKLDEQQVQSFLNSIFDTFSALADILNIPHTAISLSGTLAVSTNVGVHRGGSSAWYNPNNHSMDFVVTKEKISRAVAHEWWHALDNYLATGSTESLRPSGRYATHKFVYDMRPEVRDAIIALMTLKRTVPDFVTRTANAPSNKAYWSQGTERGARMFEQYVAGKLEQNQEHDNLLTDTPESYRKGGMWLTEEEEKKISPYFDHLFRTLKTEQTQTGNTRLFQKTGSSVVAGWFEREGDKLIVNLTKAANATTFSHEMFHAFAEVLMEQYNSGSLSKFWARQATNMFESVEAKPDENGKVTLTDTQMEHLADQFTTYILEGKIPTAEVSSIFALIKDWFKKAYVDFGIRKLGLNKKVTEVFDSIFMAQEEVEQRQRALGMIEFPMPEGADEGLYNKYVSHLLNSRAKASGKLVRAWYAMQKRRQSQEYIKRRGDIYNAVFGELSAADGYKYKALLALHNGDHVMAYNDFLAKNPDTLNSDSPMTPDVIREIAEQLPDIEEAAWKETDRRLDEEMAAEFKLDKEPAANKALRNTEKVKALLAEALLHEGKTLADFDAEYKKFMENAERLIAKLSISEKKNSKGIRNFNYWTNQETMAVERYTYAYANQNKEEMAQQRRNQALFTMIRIRGEEIENRANRFIKQFAEKLRFNQKNEIINKETGERGQLYTLEAWDLLQSVIEKFGFKIATKARINKVVTEKLEDWIKEQEGKSMTTIGFLRNFEPFVGKGYEGEFSKMSVNMFEQLDNIMTAINAVARTEKFVITESEKLHFNELKRDVRDTLKEKGIDPTTKKQTWLGKTFGALGKWTNPEPVLQEFFSSKVLNAVFRPFFTAAARADTFGNAWIARYRQAREKIKLTGKYKTFSDGTRLTDVQVLDLFLSMGTQHAYENFMMALFKEKNEERAELVVSEALAENPELANFVTEYWNLMNETADAMNESHKKRANRVLVRKEPRSFVINGIQFAGGYVPENKGLIREISEGDYNSLQMGLLANEKEISKEADGTVKSIVDNTESRLGLFAKWAYAAPEYNNICKFMQDPEIKEMLGEGLTEFVFNWLWAFQTPTIDTSGVVRPITGLVSVSSLGFRVMQGLIQLSGIIPAIPVIGIQNMLFGLRKTLLSGDIFTPIKHARAKSDYMANRYDNPMGSILGFDKKDIKRTKIGNVYQAAGMSFICYFDAIVSSAVWEGAKAKALAQGKSLEEAKMEADAAVRISQTDSMAASRSQAM
jgi:hypothetical protein